MALTYHDIPHPTSQLGLEMYAEGRKLIVDVGVRLCDIAWDADDVLWGWTMEASQIVRHSRRILMHRDMGHREYFRLKPGLFELLWGMRHASLERDLDPCIRIWTSGYVWRLAQVCGHYPGLLDLLGAPDARENTELLYHHPHIFSRSDYIGSLVELMSRGSIEESLRPWPTPVRTLLAYEFHRNPFNSSIKVPELASLVDKPHFASARMLIDDRRRNVARFAETGRQGVHVEARYPRLFKRLPHTVWKAKTYFEQGMRETTASDLVAALRSLATSASSETRRAESRPIEGSYAHVDFHIDIPNEILRGEWLEPMRGLRREARVRGWR